MKEKPVYIIEHGLHRQTRFYIKFYKGSPYLDIRKYERNQDAGFLYTGKGLAIYIKDLGEMLLGVKAVLDYIESQENKEFDDS